MELDPTIGVGCKLIQDTSISKGTKRGTRGGTGSEETGRIQGENGTSSYRFGYQGV